MFDKLKKIKIRHIIKVIREFNFNNLTESQIKKILRALGILFCIYVYYVTRTGYIPESRSFQGKSATSSERVKSTSPRSSDSFTTSETTVDRVSPKDLLPSSEEADASKLATIMGTHIVAFQPSNEQKHKRHYWEYKMYELYRIMQDGSADIDEDDIEEIRLNAPEIYERYKRQFEEYMSKRARDKPALLRKSHFILDIGELARGEKSKAVEKQEESKLPPPGRRILDHAFEVIIIRDDQEDDDSKIEREERRIRDQEEQRAYSEEYEMTQKMIRKASGEDMIFDRSTGKRRSIDEYLLSLRLCKPQAPRSRAR
jgi:hypothetical protein